MVSVWTCPTEVLGRPSLPAPQITKLLSAATALRLLAPRRGEAGALPIGSEVAGPCCRPRGLAGHTLSLGSLRTCGFFSPSRQQCPARGKERPLSPGSWVGDSPCDGGSYSGCYSGCYSAGGSGATCRPRWREAGWEPAGRAVSSRPAPPARRPWAAGSPLGPAGGFCPRGVRSAWGPVHVFSYEGTVIIDEKK